MLLPFLFLIVISNVTSQSSLRLVNLVYRHGDRSPTVIFPTDPNKADNWPDGLGWLTKLGMQQQYAMGGWLRRRYVNTGFLSRDYKNSELKVYSSDAERCLMSAQCNLAGLYPPGPNRQFNDSLYWQPIPVHTRPVPEDNELAFGEACPRYSMLANESYYLPETQREEKENKDFYEWLGNKTGIDHENINNIWMIADAVLIEKTHNLTLAPWVNDTVYDKLMFLINYQFTRFFDTPDLQRLTGGPLLAEFIDNMKKKVNTSTPSTVKMFMYSAHDGTIAALLSALKVFNGIRPPYNAMVIAELHQNINGQYYIKLSYKNDTDTDALHELVMPNCTQNCPLDTFIELTKPVVPVDWLTECAVTSGQTPATTSSTANLTCLSCRDVPHLRYCDHIERCKPDESCYISKSSGIDGHPRYNSGCVPQQVCTSASTQNSNSHCVECCSKNFCNQGGCGDRGYQGKTSRGPICLDCMNVGNIDECGTVKLCASNQVCKIEEHEWGNNERLYKLGCEDKQTCIQSRSREKRSYPLCSACCDADFCNRNCTANLQSLSTELVG